MTTYKDKQEHGSLWSGKLFAGAVKTSFVKLNPALLVRNPVIFIVGLGAVVTTGIVA